MIDKHQKLLSDLEFRLQQLMYYCELLKDENKNLKISVDQKQLEIELLDAKYTQLDQKYNNLRVAQSMLLKDDADSIDKAKERLNQLVRDVDKCISMLKV